jgi:hypothetical protein
LPVIDLSFLLRGQLSIIGGAIGGNLVIHCCFAAFR